MAPSRIGRPIERRTFLLRISFLLLGAPFGAFAQQQRAAPRIGFLYFGSKDSALRTGRYAAFLEGMRKLNYELGKDVVLEERFAGGDMALLRAQAAELVGQDVKLIVATGTVAVGELQRLTRKIPIIATVTSDPVGQGLASSLARPGGNVTGFYDSSMELVGKQLELLATVAPGLTRVGVLLNRSNKTHVDRLKRLESFGRELGLHVQPQECTTPGDIELAFPAMAGNAVKAVVVLADPFFVQQASQIADLALRHRLPSIALTRDFVESGGLMSYGEDLIDNFRSVAGYVDKILKGTAPGELPFVRTPRIELAVNSKTARALGLKLSSDFLLRADRVIE